MFDAAKLPPSIVTVAIVVYKGLIPVVGRILTIVEQLKNITSQPIEFTVKQTDIDKIRLIKNGYIQEETELLKKHVAEQLAMIKAHEQRICEVCKRGEGVWLSDFWLKVWIAVQIVVYGIIALYLMVKLW